MIPKSGKSPLDSRKSVGIHEFAALARSSLNGTKSFFFFSRLPLCSFQTRVDLTTPPSLCHWPRYFSGGARPCDQAHLPGSGPGRPPHRVERLAQTKRAAAARPRPLQLLLPPERGREGGSLRCRYRDLWPEEALGRTGTGQR